MAALFYAQFRDVTSTRVYLINIVALQYACGRRTGKRL